MRVFGNSIGKNKHSFPIQDMEEDQVSSVRQFQKSVPKGRQTFQKFEKKHSPTVTGNISSTIYEYMMATKGTQGGNLATINFAQLPGAQKRILQNTFASYTLTNYANTDFPAAIYLTCSQLNGVINPGGTTTHIIGVMLPLSATVPVYNAGGIIGYSQTYGLSVTEAQYDITNINQLTFDVSTQPTGQPIIYPLSQTLVWGLKIANATF